MRDAVRILKQLILKGSINDRDDSELFNMAQNDDNYKNLEIIADEWNFHIISTLHNIYIVPLQDNELFSMKLREVRENAGSTARNTDAYLQCYIIMVILWLFFRSKNGNPQSADSLRIKNIVEEVDIHLKNENNASELDKKQINFRAISDIWNNKVLLNEGKKSSKTQLVYTACKFLARNRLIEFRDDGDEIRPKNRLVDIMTMYYLKESRIMEINSIFEKES